MNALKPKPPFQVLIMSEESRLGARSAQTAYALDGRGWAPSAIREMLRRELYRGRMVWNETRRVDRKGTWAKQRRPESERFTVDVPALRIIDDAQWKAAHDRLTRSRATYLRTAGGRLWGRPESGIESKYLLTGFVECASCGGGFHVLKRRNLQGLRTYYVCTFHRNRGDQVCANGMLAPMETADATVIEKLQADVLSAPVVMAVVANATRAHRGEARGGAGGAGRD
jgi:hypothetical protein